MLPTYASQRAESAGPASVASVGAALVPSRVSVGRVVGLDAVAGVEIVGAVLAGEDVASRTAEETVVSRHLRRARDRRCRPLLQRYRLTVKLQRFAAGSRLPARSRTLVVTVAL